VINVGQLVSTALLNGDVAQAQQGLHFWIYLDQDPQKHKTFWVDCQSGGGGGGGGGSATPELPSSILFGLGLLPILLIAAYTGRRRRAGGAGSL